MIKETTMREGSTDYIDLQLFTGTNPANLTGNNDIDLILSDINGSVKQFSTGDSKLIVIDAARGKLQLRPAANDFYHANTPYQGYIWVNYSPSKRGSFPEDGMLKFNITPAIACPVIASLKIGAKFA